ncbi:MAG: efflux RND transporter periplasmic adaptor subunit [Cytophagales bacterium]
MKYGIAVAILSFWGLISCQSSGNSTNEQSPDERLEISEAKLNEMSVLIASPKIGNLSPIVTATGKIILPPNNDIDVSSNVSGKIQRFFIKEGNFVRKGQSLLTISSMELIQIQEQYLKSQNELEFTKLDYERQLALSANNVGATKDLQEAKQKYLSAKNSVLSVGEKLKLIGIDLAQLSGSESPNVVNTIDIKSPIDGHIFKIHATSGSFIESTTNLVSIISLNNLSADIDVFEKDLDLIQLGDEVELTFLSNRKPLKGKINQIIKSIDPSSNSVPVIVDFVAGESDNIIPEMSVKAKIFCQSKTAEKMLLPLSALIEEDELFYVFTAEKVAENWKFNKVKVMKGDNDGKYFEVLNSNEIRQKSVVTFNAHLIDAEFRKSE